MTGEDIFMNIPDLRKSSLPVVGQKGWGSQFPGQRSRAPWEERPTINCVLAVTKLNPSYMSPRATGLSGLLYPLCHPHFIPSLSLLWVTLVFSRLAGSGARTPTMTFSTTRWPSAVFLKKVSLLSQEPSRICPLVCI